MATPEANKLPDKWFLLYQTIGPDYLQTMVAPAAGKH
jgi:hypothetical protein